MSRRPAPAPESPTGLLASVRAADTRIRAAELEKAYAVLAWLDAHPAESIRDAAGRFDHAAGGPQGVLHGERALLLGGEGSPLVAEFCLAELAVTLQVSDHTARALASDLLELTHRLPDLWSRVQTLDIPLWRARRIACRTTRLDPAHAARADRLLTPIAHRLTTPRVDGCVTRLLAEQHDLRPEPVETARARRHVHIALPATCVGGAYAPGDDGLAGLGHVSATLDVLDAADLDRALDVIAAQLAAGQPGASDDELRAQALGILGRGELLLPLPDAGVAGTGEAVTHVDPGIGEASAVAPVIDRHGRTRASRELVIHIHLSAASLTSTAVTSTAVTGAEPAASDQLAAVESGPVRLVDIDTVRAWAAQALAETTAGWAGRVDPTRLTIRPVLDLAEQHASAGYTPSPRLREQVVLRDGTCCFPGCDRPARSGDIDHIAPWQPPDPHAADPPKQTTTDNLAVLCRPHHRLKTHSRWRYQRIGPPQRAAYDWTSPTGQHVRRNADGTVDLGMPAPF